MSSAGMHRNSSTRTVRKIEAPRPLKESSLNELNQKASYSPLALSSYAIDCVEKLIALMDMVVNSIDQYDESNSATDSALLTGNIIHLCKHLRIYGPQLENSIYQGQLDRAFLSFREGLIRSTLDYEARAHLLDIVELRECNWIPRKNLSPATHESNECSEYPTADAYANFGSDEVLKRSAKNRDKSSKTTSKSYLRNEVIIKNSDSGKVMGIKGRRVHMIEQLSETIISFQRVPPTATERVVQITGSNEDRIAYASKLIENTIRNNASPVKDFCGSESSCSSEDSYGCEDLTNFNYQPIKTADQPYLYKHKVFVRNCQLSITGDDYAYVTVAKAILDDYFSKLRTSDSSDDISKCDDNLLDDKIYGHEEFEKSMSCPLSAMSSRTDLKPQIVDSSADHSLSYFELNSRNSPAAHQHNSALLVDKNATSSLRNLSMKSVFNVSQKEHIFPAESRDLASGESSPRTAYTKEYLLALQKSDLSQRKPDDWELITRRFPQLLKELEKCAEGELIVID